MSTRPSRLVVLLLGLALVLVPHASTGQPPEQNLEQKMTESERIGELRLENEHLNVHYLEIVTPSVNETCDALEKVHGVTFGEAVAELGNARTARLKDGGRIGVRAPMAEAEEPVVRPYLLVDDVHAAIKAAADAGALVAMPPTEISGQGTFAIYFLGGMQYGLWQI